MTAKKLPAARRRDRDARARSLIFAAGRLFASRGYEATTTREIAAAAGCSEGLIHRYFVSKAGLLRALIQSRVSEDVWNLEGALPPARTVEHEIVQLVDWEIRQMWQDREFLGVIIPRALLDRRLRLILRETGATRRAEAIADRLRSYEVCRRLPNDELKALVDFIGVLGLMFGFMRPRVLGQDRVAAKRTAETIARMLSRTLNSGKKKPSSASASPNRQSLFSP